MTVSFEPEPLPSFPAFPARLNLAEYFLDHNLDAGRAGKAALWVGDEMRTYGRVAERSRRVAAALRRAGVRPEERVLLVLPDGFEFAEAFFGVLRAGAVFAMVNPLLKCEEYAYYLEYSKARVVIAHASTLPELAPAFRRARLAKSLFVVGPSTDFTPYEDALDAEDPDSDLAATEPTGPDDLAGWLFTSGSTGRSKACVHRQRDFAYSTETYARRVVGYRESDVCLSVPKLFFGYATGTNLMFPFRFGGSVALFAQRATAEELFDQIAMHSPTVLTSVPTMVNNMLRSERMAGADLGSLRVTLSAGEALPRPLLEEWQARAGVEILDGIGSAEMFHIYITNHPGEVKPGSLGRVVEGYEARIIDGSGRGVSDGEPGRLQVRGGSTAICYWADRDKSIETFAGEWCTSADIFRRDAEGFYWYEGRSDDLLKCSGIWVSPIEIEEALLAHPAVAQVCVVGHDEGDGLVKPLAFVVPRVGHVGDDTLGEALKIHLKGLLAPHKYPRWFLWRADLPKNDRGKVARRELKAQLEAVRSEKVS